jgi:protein-disulfide isomerase
MTDKKDTAVVKDSVTIDILPLLMPGAVLLSALMVSFSLLIGFNNLAGAWRSGGTGTTPTTTGTDTTDTGEAPLSVSNLKIMASKISGMDTGKFNTCLDSGAKASSVSSATAKGTEAGVTGTPGFFVGERTGDFKVKGFLIPGAYPYDAYKNAFNDITNSGVETAVEKFNTAYDLESKISEISFGEAPYLGDLGAKVQIVEFTDFECPFCQRHFKQVYPTIKSEFIDTKKIAYISMDFPLSIHAIAQKSAEAAQCAREQNKYWEMHDAMFKSY